MSLKQHLFLLVAFLVVLLSSIQLYFAYQLKQQMNLEIEQRSKAISRKAIDTLVERIKSVEVFTEADQLVDIDEKGRLIIGGQVEMHVEKEDSEQATSTPDTVKFTRKKITVDLNEPKHVQVIDLHKQIESIADSIEIKSLGENMTYVIEQKGATQNVQMVHLFEQESLIDQFFDQLLWVIAVITMIGLLLAYWIAHYSSRPFNRLSMGFSKVEKGEFGSEVAVSGVTEVRDTLKGFNFMSHQLRHLQENDKRLQGQEHLAELGEVARGLAHSLRNPINTLGLALEQMGLDTTSSEQRANIAESGRKKINAMDNTIKALLNLTATGVRRDLTIRLQDIIDDVCLECSMINTSHFDVDVSKDLSLQGDSSEIRAIIHTLVVNAAEASIDGGSITIQGVANEQKIILKVTDLGEGVSASIKENLFKPHITDKSEGAGMGLYIARRLARLYYQGDIEIKANEPKGTVAILTLTAKQDENKQ
jgi:signal transduction histidine kinase